MLVMPHAECAYYNDHKRTLELKFVELQLTRMGYTEI